MKESTENGVGPDEDGNEKRTLTYRVPRWLSGSIMTGAEEEGITWSGCHVAWLPKSMNIQ